MDYTDYTVSIIIDREKLKKVTYHLRLTLTPPKEDPCDFPPSTNDVVRGLPLILNKIFE